LYVSTTQLYLGTIVTVTSSFIKRKQFLFDI